MKPYTFARPRPNGRPPLSRGPGLVILVLGLTALCASRVDLAGSEWHTAVRTQPPDPTPVLEAPEPETVLTAPAEPTIIELTGIIGRGEVFSEALTRQGIEHEAVFELVSSL